MSYIGNQPAPTNVTTTDITDGTITNADISSSAAIAASKLSGVLTDIVGDTSPQLGGNLDINGQDIVTTSNADIDLAPNGTGKVVVKGNTNPGTVVFNCESNSHGQTVKSQPHSASVTNVLTLPAGGDQEIVGTTATQTLTNKTMGATSFGDNNITNVGDIALDSISADGTDINVAVSDNSATAFTIKQGSDNYFVVDTGNSSESIAIGTGVSGTAITLGHSTSEVTVADNLTVTGNLTVSGTTTTINTATLDVADLNITVADGAADAAAANGAGLTVDGASATFNYASSGDKWTMNKPLDVTGAVTATGTTVNGTLDIEEVYEKVTVQTSTTGTITFDTTVQAVELYTANQTANRTINFTNVNSNLAVGQSLTVSIAMTQGSTPYYLNAYQVDSSSVTPKWAGGSAPTAGNASSIDTYTFTIIKTANATFTVLASLTQFA